MTQIDGWEIESEGEHLYIHFDVEDHFLKLETFVKTAECAQRVVEALNDSFFHGSLEYELIVLAPEPGTFLSKFGFVIVGGVTGLFAFANSSIGSSYIEALTGQPPTFWAEQVGTHNREWIEETLEYIEDWKDADETTSNADEEQDKDKVTERELSPDNDYACKIGAKIMTEMTKGILSKETEELNQIGMEAADLPEAVDARGDFYLACLDDKDVRGVGFTDDDDFPIPRNSFPQRALKPPRKEKEDEPIPWVVSEESIYVTSPNWDREDHQSRQWKGKDSIRRDCYFVIEDAEFWYHVQKKDLRVNVLDNLKVQWAYQEINGRIKNRRVLRVLEFNGEKLADPLPPESVRAILGDFSSINANRDQASLFGDD